MGLYLLKYLLAFLGFKFILSNIYLFLSTELDYPSGSHSLTNYGGRSLRENQKANGKTSDILSIDEDEDEDDFSYLDQFYKNRNKAKKNDSGCAILCQPFVSILFISMVFSLVSIAIAPIAFLC